VTETVVIRSPRAADAEALAALLNMHSRALSGSDDTTPAEVRAWFSLPGIDPEHDMRVALSPDGRLLGYADIAGTGEGPLHVDLRFPPEHAEVAPALLDAMERRAAERGQQGRRLRVHVQAADTALRRLVEARGYRPVRSSYRMEVDVRARPEPPRWPDGIAVRPYRAHDDLERVYTTAEEGFSDHWGYEPVTLEEWSGWNVRDTLDFSLWFLAEEADEPAGVCLCRLDETPDAALGWVSVLAVRPAWRRRGLGRAFLLHAFAELRTRGRERVGLGVDTENTTGAVRLYESVGMTAVRRSDTYERETT
jgi:mycothiol synthase